MFFSGTISVSGNVLFWFTIIFVGWFIIRVVIKGRMVKEESLLVIRDLGVQINTKYYSGGGTSEFIDRKKIKSIIINEGITMGDIIFYMAIIVRKKEKMVIVFKTLRPRIDTLLDIFKGSRAIMFGS
uniref:Phosphatidylinositol N-acetylglucosaminyltransferase subunit H conserved domain-containing protein n=1 Tax=Arcella intermedia TaxID=1963864 RepID=A0A6B2LLF0_9EUKA